MVLLHLDRVIVFCIMGLLLPLPGLIKLKERASGFALMNLTWSMADLTAVYWIFNHINSQHILSVKVHQLHIAEMMGWNVLLDLGYLIIGLFLWHFRKGPRPAMREGLALGVIWQGVGLLILDNWLLFSLP